MTFLLWLEEEEEEEEEEEAADQPRQYLQQFAPLHPSQP